MVWLRSSCFVLRGYVQRKGKIFVEKKEWRAEKRNVDVHRQDARRRRAKECRLAFVEVQGVGKHEAEASRFGPLFDNGHAGLCFYKADEVRGDVSL
jgi:hypothetical protein